MLYPELNYVREKFKTYPRVPVVKRFFCDTYTPIQVFESLKSAYGQNCFMLESVNGSEQWGRYSFIGVEPSHAVRVLGGKVYIDGDNSGSEDVFGVLNAYLARNRSPVIPDMPHFTGGLVGYFSYDFARNVEKRLRDTAPPDDLGLADAVLYEFDTVIAFDHLKHQVMVVTNLCADDDLTRQYNDAILQADKIWEVILRGKPSPVKPPRGEVKITSNIDEARFCANVAKAQEYIRNGDIFQVVLSRRFAVENPPDSFSVYRALRVINPSPYMFYLNTPEIEVAASSPETLISADSDENGDTIVKIKPLAGTIKRGDSEAEDAENEKKLLADEKERAEHTMLVDLGRNDVGRIARFGTVKVGGYMQAEKYATVIHLVSDISGVLRTDKTALDAIAAVLPAGTLSGAPKVRAMEIIDELEPNKRCLYGGSAGYIGFDGGFDLCIAIRMVLYRGGRAYVGAGAGIVADSVPKREFAETQVKAGAVLKAIERGRELEQEAYDLCINATVRESMNEGTHERDNMSATERANISTAECTNTNTTERGNVSTAEHTNIGGQIQ